MGPKTLPTIWGTYMKLVTKYQIYAINSCWEKCDEKCAYMFNMLIFRSIFLRNYWWQKSDIWSQASYRYPISWEAFLDPSDSYFLFAEERGYHKWALAHSSSCYNQFDTTSCSYLSQDMTWISIDICHGLFVCPIIWPSLFKCTFHNWQSGCRHGRIVVGFTTTCAISAYHHYVLIMF